MTIRPPEEAVVVDAVASALSGRQRAVLAVSGGLDSMVLLDASRQAFGASRSGLLVASFDHRTGAAASRATRLVERRAKSLGLRCVTGVATQAWTKEHEWREERWRFLRATAKEMSAPVVTAHSLDDQVETVFMRILRDAGPRGLAGLYADSDVLRPFIALRRSDLESYARSRRLSWLDDPSNESRAHLRNRVRHELLPAIMRVRPSFPAQLLTIAEMSAAWREEMENAVRRIDHEVDRDGSLRVSRSQLRNLDAESLRAVWPALASHIGVVMDRRGTERLAAFTRQGNTGGSIQLSGGIEVRMEREHLVMRRWDVSRVELLRQTRAMPLGFERTRAELS